MLPNCRLAPAASPLLLPIARVGVEVDFPLSLSAVASPARGVSVRRARIPTNHSLPAAHSLALIYPDLIIRIQVTIWWGVPSKRACRGQASQKLLRLVPCPLKLRIAAITEPTGRYLRRRMARVRSIQWAQGKTW
jgi:hypothetical protein